MTTTRRSVLGGLAAMSAAALPGQALASPEAPSGLSALIDAHKAACDAYEAAESLYYRTMKEIPEARVSLFPEGEPEGWRWGALTLSCHGDIDAFARWFGAPFSNSEGFAWWQENRTAALNAARAQRELACEAAGLDRLKLALEAASDAEFAAYDAVRDCHPADMAEVREKALYLIEHAGENDDAVQLLRAFAA